MGTMMRLDARCDLSALRLELDAMYDFSYFSDGIQAHPAEASELQRLYNMWLDWIRNAAAFPAISGP